MKKLVIFIVSCGPNANKKNISLTLNSIHEHIGIDDYQIYAFVDREDLKEHYIDELHCDNIANIVVSNKGIGEQFNEFFDDVKNKYEYMIYSHDDLLLHSKYIYQRTMDIIELSYQEIGFVTYTNKGYHLSGKVVSNSIRPGIANDRMNYPKVFECHKGDLEQLDFPDEPIHVFGPFSHFNFISMKSMKKIGYSETWTPTPMLMDEDWALTSNIKGLTNVWIPDVNYEHPIQETENERVTTNLARHTPQSHAAFIKKWGIDVPYSDDAINILMKKYGKTNLKYFFNKNTYDWKYL
jgi:hypothetical protein